MPDHLPRLPESATQPVESRRVFLKNATIGATGLAIATLISSKLMDSPEHGPQEHTAPAHSAEKPKEIPILTQPEAEKLLRNRAQERRVEEVLAREGCHCVDGRGESTETFGLAGGDLGPVSAILAAAEELSGQHIDRATVLKVLEGIPGKAYVHTDDHALHAMHDRLADQLHGTTAEKLVQHGPTDPGHRTQVADTLADPACIGCGHMKQIITQKETDASGPYRMRPALGHDVLSAAYEHAWQNADHVKVESLHGEHQEAGVMVVTEKDGITDGTSSVPTVQPCAKDAAGKTVQTFVNQPQVGEYRLDQLLKLILEQIPALAPQAIELRTLATEIFNQQTGETVKRLATSKGKPVFVAQYDKGALLSVEQVP